MTDSQNYVPEGYSVVTPSLTVSDADKAIAFYREVFGATVLPTRLADSKGAVYFSEIAIGDSRVMITDEVAGNVSPESLGGSPVRLVIYVSDVDAVMERAVAAGGTIVIPAADQFYGDRSARLCSAPGFLDSGLTVFASMLPRPARRSHVAPERGFDSGTSLASTARCTSA